MIYVCDERAILVKGC